MKWSSTLAPEVDPRHGRYPLWFGEPLCPTQPLLGGQEDFSSGVDDDPQGSGGDQGMRQLGGVTKCTRAFGDGLLTRLEQNPDVAYSVRDAVGKSKVQLVTFERLVDELHVQRELIVGKIVGPLRAVIWKQDSTQLFAALCPSRPSKNSIEKSHRETFSQRTKKWKTCRVSSAFRTFLMPSLVYN